MPASHRIDMRKVRTLVEDPHAELATEEMLAGAYPEFELGAVPPMGGHGPDSVLVDERLAKEPSVVFEAGSHEHSVRMTTADVLSLTNARVADIRQD